MDFVFSLAGYGLIFLVVVGLTNLLWSGIKMALSVGRNK